MPVDSTNGTVAARAPGLSSKSALEDAWSVVAVDVWAAPNLSILYSEDIPTTSLPTVLEPAPLLPSKVGAPRRDSRVAEAAGKR